MKILVVDDEPAITKILQTAFGLAGHEVKTAANGREAVTLLSRESYDVVLSDVRMPEMDGHELARWTAAERPATRTILMTGYDARCQRCSYSPRCIVIPKPFLPLKVVDIVEQAVGQPRSDATK